jgi:hypothetical protein
MIDQLHGFDRKDSRKTIDVQSRKSMCRKACAQCHQIASPLFYHHKVDKLYCGPCLKEEDSPGLRAMTKLSKVPSDGDRPTSSNLH